MESPRRVSVFEPVSVTMRHCVGLDLPRFRRHFVVPLLFERPWTEIAERRMPPQPVVKRLEILEQVAALRRSRVPRGIVDEFDLERREEGLGDGVVPAIPSAAHAADNSALLEDSLVVTAGVLTPAIGVMHQARRWPSPRERHVEGAEREVVRYVEPALARRNVCDVGDPGLLRATRVNCRAKRLGATGNGCCDCVVTRNRRRRRASNPRTRIRRATRLRPVRPPPSRNST
jgi:hypothetical protein